MFKLPHNPATAYSAQDQLVWKILFDRQTALLHRRAAPVFSEGLARLGLRRDAIPEIRALSEQVQVLSGWQLVPFGQQVDLTTFFGLLAERKFPVVTRLRLMRDFDFTSAPDLFHDLFGHVPMLLDAAFANFLHELGQAAQVLPAADTVTRRQLWALYFFTAEFGLVRHDNKLRLYGAGLLSSAGEIHHCMDEETPRSDFDLSTVLSTPVLDTRFQNQYFVLPDWEQLASYAAELTGLLATDWRQAA
ncbi:phenylalanine-4-hydroxylase [Hymenobacter sp. ASUV-10]|uniref:Phenylalanine-4-hydroxylase n=1 Tax=Hymenobacter aranciens TaxID=3063996 RepID=A0ABT9BCX6_9BACT|nr:phenylalanine-4-hydroxylase [Hymenobacter sp. ASUV-10]MDO7876112.1 phenylalanine-4-hydroxylase [Hymenobacter sp. ASUV-10]